MDPSAMPRRSRVNGALGVVTPSTRDQVEGVETYLETNAVGKIREQATWKIGPVHSVRKCTWPNPARKAHHVQGGRGPFGRVQKKRQPSRKNQHRNMSCWHMPC